MSFLFLKKMLLTSVLVLLKEKYKRLFIFTYFVVHEVSNSVLFTEILLSFKTWRPKASKNRGNKTGELKIIKFTN